MKWTISFKKLREMSTSSVLAFECFHPLGRAERKAHHSFRYFGGGRMRLRPPDWQFSLPSAAVTDRQKKIFLGGKNCHVMDSFELISTFVKLVNTDPPIVWNGSRWRRCFDPKRQVSRQQEIIWMKWGTRASRWLAVYYLAHQKDTRAVQQMENSSGKCARPQRNNKRPKRSDEPPSVSSSRGLSS